MKSYDDKSIIELETSTHLFTITCTWSICNEYAGFINELNSYLLSGYGKETQAYYMLDKGNNSFLNLESHYDYGSGLPSLSPQSTKMITSENTDNRDEEYYDFKSEIVIYDISDIKYLDDIKTWKHFTTDDWRISSIAWIDENSFALEICDKIERDNKGKVKKLTNKRYLKATIE